MARNVDEGVRREMVYVYGEWKVEKDTFNCWLERHIACTLRHTSTEDE